MQIPGCPNFLGGIFMIPGLPGILTNIIMCRCLDYKFYPNLSAVSFRFTDGHMLQDILWY